MNTSLSWIKKYVPDLDVTAREYADGMTLSGTKVENYEELDRDLDKIVVGEILSCEPHPDSDHLHICMVNVGGAEDPLQIVCGAPNVAVGQKVPVVLEGGRVAGSRDGDKTEGGIRIKAGNQILVDETVSMGGRSKTYKLTYGGQGQEQNVEVLEGN